MALPGEDAPGQTADQLEPVGGRVDQDEFGHRQCLVQPGEAVDELGSVGGSAAYDCEFHPLTPVSVTPSMKAF